MHPATESAQFPAPGAYYSGRGHLRLAGGVGGILRLQSSGQLPLAEW